MKYSLIIPVYNRPDEVDELLDSLTKQHYTEFEVLVVEDGSSNSCESVVDRYAELLNIHYFVKSNSGPGQTRNYGAERSHGEYLIILDSDCVLPPGYLDAIEAELQRNPADAFGGPDRANDSFSSIQKAINYAMTSFLQLEVFGEVRGKWISSIPVVLIWEYGERFIRHWEDFRRCVLVKILTSASGFSKMAIIAGFFLKPGCGISAVRTGINFQASIQFGDCTY